MLKGKSTRLNNEEVLIVSEPLVLHGIMQVCVLTDGILLEAPITSLRFTVVPPTISDEIVNLVRSELHDYRNMIGYSEDVGSLADLAEDIEKLLSRTVV